MSFYLKIISLILCFSSSSNTVLATQSKSDFPIIWNVQNANDYYVGRQNIIKDLYNFLNKKGTEVSIVGSAGIGKTQLAKKYAEIHREKYDIIWWFDVGKNMGEQYVRLVNEWNRINDDPKMHINLHVPQDEIIRQMKDNLRITGLNWLLIFDNVTDKSQISAYIPSKHNTSLGHILITSKNPYTWNHVMKLEKFTRAESIELFQKIGNEDSPSSLNTLAEILADYPLAVVQAASYIKSHPGLNAQQYIQLFLTNREKLWADESKSKHMAFDNYNHTVFTTLSLTINEIKKESPEAFEMLVFCSYLNNKSIPDTLLASYSTNILKADDLSLRNSISILGKYSLISENKSAQAKSESITFTMHELYQLTVQDMLSKKEKKEYLTKGLSAAANFLSDKMDVFIAYLLDYPYFVFNIDSIVEHALVSEIYNNDLMTLEQRLLEYHLSGRRDFPTAQKLIEGIEKLAKKVPDLDTVLKARFAIMKSAFLAWQNIDYKESHRYALEALEILKKTPYKYEDNLMAYNRLAQLYHLMGDNENALIYANKGEEVASQDQTVGNQDALSQTFARIYLDNGEFKLALKYAEKTIIKIANKSEKMLVGEIPLYLTRPIALLKMTKYDEAFKYFGEIYDASNDIFGENDHFYKAVIYCYYGYTLFAYKNEFIKSKYLLLQSQEMFKRLFGKNSNKNKSLAICHRFLGEIFEKEENNSRAQQEYSRALQIITNSYNGSLKAIDDFSELYTRLAIINAKLKDTITAQQYLDLHKKVFGYDHHRTKEITSYFIENKMTVGF